MMSKKEGTLFIIGFIAAITLFICGNPWWGFAAMLFLGTWVKIAAERPSHQWAPVHVHDDALSVSVIALHPICDKHGIVGYEVRYRVVNQSGKPLIVSNDLFALYENGAECHDTTEIDTFSLLPGGSCPLKQLFAKHNGKRGGLTLIDRSTGIPLPQMPASSVPNTPGSKKDGTHMDYRLAHASTLPILHRS